MNHRSKEYFTHDNEKNSFHVHLVPMKIELLFSDEELDRVITYGNLTIGDRHNSTDIDGIYFDGINYNSAMNGILVNAHHTNVTHWIMKYYN